MMTSPKKKMLKFTPESNFKRKNENENICVKRSKPEIIDDEESRIKKMQAMKRKNFISACEKVSCKAYFDFRTRLQLVYLTPCANEKVCKHHNFNGKHIKEMPESAEESVKIEMKTNMWFEALEVCQMCITSDQYLSANVLKDIVEIMMNAHEDTSAENTIMFLIDKCQQILGQNFSAHPPCLSKSIKKCYNNFLTSPMHLRDNTFTNRTEFDCNKGLVKYCMNRLEHEISSDSKDTPLVDKYENVPEEMKQSVKGLHWQKEKLEIYESLDRPERIKRLIAVLESIIELLQFDLVIWLSRYTSNLGSHIMRSHKPLMAYILWSNNVLCTGAVNNNCRQVFRLFIYLIHLEYPENYIRIMTMWLNTIFQTFYICETNSNSDYPNTGKYCNAFSHEFYKILSGMPQNTIIRVLKRIQPSHMRYLIGNLHIKTLLSTQEDDIIRIFIEFLKHSQWNNFPEGRNEICLSKMPINKPNKIKNILRYSSKICKISKLNSSLSLNLNKQLYLKWDPNVIEKDKQVFQIHVVHIIYISLEAYLDAYSVQSVQETLEVLNEQLLQDNSNSVDVEINTNSYSVTETFIKKYRSIYQMLKELMLLLNDLKCKGELPELFTIFENIGLLGS